MKMSYSVGLPPSTGISHSPEPALAADESSVDADPTEVVPAALVDAVVTSIGEPVSLADVAGAGPQAA